MKPSKEEIECILIAREIKLKVWKRKGREAMLFEEIELAEVPEEKLFSKLWAKHGLPNTGSYSLFDNGIQQEERRECIIKWCKILFSFKINILQIEEEIRLRHEAEFIEERKKGNHISFFVSR